MKSSKSTLADLRQLQSQAIEEPGPPAAEPRRPVRSTKQASQRTTTAKKSSAQLGSVTAAPTSPDTALSAAPLDPADRSLFEQAMRFVQPLTRHGSHARGRMHRDPEALLQIRRARAQGEEAYAERPAPRNHRRAPAVIDPDAHEFLQTGCGTDLLRGLRRGKWTPEAILDLHGSTEDEAHERLDRFITTCVAHDIRCVRIVHGKGIGSRHGTPVLKAATRIHLCRLAAVQAWVECAEPDGGAGAVTALLKTPQAPS